MSLINLQADLGRSKFKPKFTEVFSRSPRVNRLAAARLFLFAARDIWFVVALPVFLGSQLGWSHSAVGAFLAVWIIGYGMVQALVPQLYRKAAPTGLNACLWVSGLAIVTAALATAVAQVEAVEAVLVVGLLIFGAVFAVNSAIHSYLVVSYAGQDDVSMEVGFYYTANAMGRLLGTVLSGWVFQAYGLEACLWGAVILLVVATLCSLRLLTPAAQTDH